MGGSQQFLVNLGRLKRLGSICRGGTRWAFGENQTPTDGVTEKGLLVQQLREEEALSGGFSMRRALKI